VFDFPAIVRTTTLLLVVAMLLMKSRRLEWFAAIFILCSGIARLWTQAVR
jgi:hypothetical protein